MNYFNLIFSNRSILRILQIEIFKKFKINGDIIEFGASEEKILIELKYDYIIIFNVLEHLLDPNLALRNLSKICKKNGKIIGSTPFLFRVHGAPKDYSRFTKDHLIELLKSCNFKDIEIIELGTGPFLACISLLRSYLKYIPIFYQLLVLFALVFDKLIKLFIKTDPKKIYPIGYIFFATNT